MITLTREEAQQVLDALEDYEPNEAHNVVEALRARLAQPEPKPACWLYKGEVRLSPSDLPPEETIALYTSPPQREWQGLTDEEKQRFNKHIGLYFLKQIEDILKEKNG